MYSHPQRRSAEEVQELRREAGRRLRDLRDVRGLSQRQLAELVGVEQYTFVSQLETGRGRIPPDKYAIWAVALGVDVREFVFMLMRYYDPVTYGILFPAVSTERPTEAEALAQEIPLAPQAAEGSNVYLFSA